MASGSSRVSISLCDQLEAVRLGEYLHGYTEVHLSTSTRRPTEEPAPIGQAAVKGAMARRLAGELSGAPVRWSSAILIGPVSCPSFNAFQILIDPIDIRIVARVPGQGAQ